MSRCPPVIFHNARELLDFESSSSGPLSSGCPLLDDLIGGGFLPGTVTEISGEAGCGKSQICMQLAATSIANGLDVVCVETERGFSVKRVHQMLEFRAENVEEALQHLLISSPSTIEQFMHVLTKLEQSTEELSKTSVLVIDSIATFFRGRLHREDLQNWRRVLVILCNVAIRHNVAVIYVNHVASRKDPSSEEWATAPFLFHVLARRPTIRIWLKRASDGPKTSRSITLMKSPFSPKLSAEFFITNSGVSLLADDKSN
uniref:RECA_2 domain-containing protein n=1 Tax=Haemonchus contortus TaxID=6289 RepID=A0A7I5E8T7_HAECO